MGLAGCWPCPSMKLVADQEALAVTGLRGGVSMICGDSAEGMGEERQRRIGVIIAMGLRFTFLPAWMD